ncbi:MAG: TylF/MycF/NovP-related O-methyltransferase [Planctomycetota bacterium]
MLTPLIQHARRAVSLGRYRRIARKFRAFTMIPPATYVANLRVAAKCRGVPGCVVECGVWRGGMIAGIAEVLGPGRQYHLFDSFAGLPPAGERDGPAARAWQADRGLWWNFDNCTAPPDYAERAMRLAGARRFALHPGWFEDTLRSFAPAEPIALLRLDGDWYESTLTCMNALYPHLAHGGLIIVDDYYVWDGCCRAVHAFLAERDLPLRITQRFGRVCVLRVPDAGQ